MSDSVDANNNQSGDAIVSGSVVTECPEFSQKACYARGTKNTVYVGFPDDDKKSMIKVTTSVDGKLSAEEVLDEDKMTNDIKTQNDIDTTSEAERVDENGRGGARRKRRSNKRKPKKSAKKPKRSKKGKTRKQKK